MSKNFPFMAELEPGTYYWCSCGMSRTEPFCDGSHKGTNYDPVRFVVTEKKKAGVCQCQRTKKPPFCDGTHARVD
jgi:CDGSH-type Zn-finger protein